MTRLTSKSYTNNGTWTCPAGITEVILSVSYPSSPGSVVSRSVTVIPGTTYNIVFNTDPYISCTFGSLFKWTDYFGSTLKVTWVE